LRFALPGCRFAETQRRIAEQKNGSGARLATPRRFFTGEQMSRPQRSNWLKAPWILVTQRDLAIEREQAADEGRDLAALEPEFDALAELDLDVAENRVRAEALLDAVADAPIASAAAMREPSDLPAIRQQRCAAMPDLGAPPPETGRFDKALGGWVGRSAGCLLGKPAEGRRSWQIRKYLESQDRWPLEAYFSADAPDEVAAECGFAGRAAGLFEEGITCMPEDDDTNYTVTGFAILKQFGHAFTPEDVARFWLQNIPLLHLCTAERVAYRNLSEGIPPPHSAAYRNPFREWIGAQIRADFFGFVCPGDPARAAEYAWRDASISHVKNGIYGEMWVAAMLAAAAVTDDIETVVQAGLSQIPAECRLAHAVDRICRLRRRGLSYDDMIEDLSTRWDENNPHHWCHTISNAEIVAIALLWGEKDFTQTICAAVMPGFDTDCNGATAGSVLGVLLGAAALPPYWTTPLNDTLLTGVTGYTRVALSDMASRTVELMHSG
jgi:ADP-ribosylglycohydrolase